MVTFKKNRGLGDAAADAANNLTASGNITISAEEEQRVRDALKNAENALIEKEKIEMYWKWGLFSLVLIFILIYYFKKK